VARFVTQGEGCYGVQVDGASFSYRISFGALWQG
jgi:hypothetical protein